MAANEDDDDNDYVDRDGCDNEKIPNSSKKRTAATLITTTSSTGTGTGTGTGTSRREKCSMCHQRYSKDTCIMQLCFQCCTADDCQIHQKQRISAQWKQSVIDGTTVIQRQARHLRTLRIGGPSSASLAFDHGSSVTNTGSSTLGTHPRNASNNNKRRRNFFYETNFIYIGDTIVIWDIQEYIRNDRNVTCAAAVAAATAIAIGRTGNSNHSTSHNNDALRKSIRRNPNKLQQQQGQDEALSTTTTSTTVDRQCHRNHRLRNNRQRFYRIMNDLYMASTTTTTTTTTIVPAATALTTTAK